MKNESQLRSLRISTNNLLIILIGLCFVLYLPGMWIDVMEVDAAQYASMSMEMLQTGNFLQLYEQGRDYLDKPPLLFWMSSFGYLLFGFHNWVYKLPSVLFTLLAIYATYRYVRLHHDKTTALLASLILASSQAIFLMNNDVRTDNLLMGAMMLAFWQIGEIDKGHRHLKHFIGVGVGIGLAMLSKGPLGLVIPILGYGCVWLWMRKWQTLFQWGWILSLAIILLLLLPMCIGLYLQFDSQPDKEMFGRKGVSGLYFFFWEQSFGRVTGASTWANDAGPFFFVHTYIYAFLPWVVFLPAYVWQLIKNRTQQEWFSTASFVLTFAALTASRFKLPHYIYITIPFAAMMIAPVLIPILRYKWVTVYTWLLWVIILAFSVLILTVVFPIHWTGGLIIGLLSLMILLASFTLTKDQSVYQLGKLVGGMLVVNILMSCWFYPQLLDYQSSSVAMKWLDSQSGDTKEVYHFQSSKSALHFYNKAVVENVEEMDLSQKDKVWVFVRDAVQTEFESKYPQARQVHTFEDFPVTRLNIVFLNPHSRDQVKGHSFLYTIARE